MHGFDLARWKSLEPLVDDALSLTGRERDQWLEALRARDAGVAAELPTMSLKWRMRL